MRAKANFFTFSFFRETRRRIFVAQINIAVGARVCALVSVYGAYHPAVVGGGKFLVSGFRKRVETETRGVLCSSWVAILWSFVSLPARALILSLPLPHTKRE